MIRSLLLNGVSIHIVCVCTMWEFCRNFSQSAYAYVEEADWWWTVSSLWLGIWHCVTLARNVTSLSWCYFERRHSTPSVMLTAGLTLLWHHMAWAMRLSPPLYFIHQQQNTDMHTVMMVVWCGHGGISPTAVSQRRAQRAVGDVRVVCHQATTAVPRLCLPRIARKIHNTESHGHVTDKAKS